MGALSAQIRGFTECVARLLNVCDGFCAPSIDLGVPPRVRLSAEARTLLIPRCPLNVFSVVRAQAINVSKEKHSEKSAHQHELSATATMIQTEKIGMFLKVWRVTQGPREKRNAPYRLTISMRIQLLRT